MRMKRSRRCAGALLAVLAATLLLPLAALARLSAPAAEPHRCHCPVKMACCEAGLCHGGEESSPTSGPSWSGCRDEASHQDAVPAPSTALDSALLPASVSSATESRSAFAFLVPARVSAPGRAPAIPPPRTSIAPC